MPQAQYRNVPRSLTVAFSTRSYTPQTARYIRHLKRSSGLKEIEVLFTPNPGRVGLSELYNHYLKIAKNDIVCLMHDDLHFYPQARWGRQILSAFQHHPEFAVLGAAGSVQLSDHGIFWLPPEAMLGQVRHWHRGQWHHSRYSQSFKHPLEALVLDGLFLALHRQRISQNFDERFKGFHFYDMALSLNQSLAHETRQGGACGILTQLNIGHRSPGTPTAAYEEAREQFVEAYAHLLPGTLRPQLQVKNQAGPATGPELEILIWHHHAQISLQALIQRLQQSRYRSKQITLLNGAPQENTPLGKAPVALPESIKQFPISPSASWHELVPVLKPLVERSSAEFILLLDSQTLPLHDWLPAMISQFLKHPKLGSLSPRLHYADDHLLFQNGLKLQQHAQGRFDIRHRGIHSPYDYAQNLEWQTLGGSAVALMLRKADLLQHLETMQQSWVPGLELNLQLLLQGQHNAVDSRLVAYWLAKDEPKDQDYLYFQNYLKDWMQAHKSHPALLRQLSAVD